MNEVQLAGWFATEAALDRTETEVTRASFIIRVADENGTEQFFRVICEGSAAAKVGAEAALAKLRGRLAAVTGSLRQSELTEGGQQTKATYIEGGRIEFLDSSHDVPA